MRNNYKITITVENGKIDIQNSTNNLHNIRTCFEESELENNISEDTRNTAALRVRPQVMPRDPDTYIVGKDGARYKVGESSLHGMHGDDYYYKYKELDNMELKRYYDPGVGRYGQNKWLNNADLSRTQITGLKLYKAESSRKFDATNTKFDDSELTNCQFEGADLSNATFLGTVLVNNKFIIASLNNCKFNESYIIDTLFYYVTADDADFSDSTWDNVTSNESNSFKKCKMHRTKFIGGDFSNASFELAELTNANFVNSTLTNCNFQKAKLINANLEKCDLKGADLKGANLTNADLRGSNWWEAIHDTTTIWTHSMRDPRPTRR